MPATAEDQNRNVPASTEAKDTTTTGVQSIESSTIHSGASSNSLMSGSSNGSLHDATGQANVHAHNPHHHQHHQHHQHHTHNVEGATFPETNDSLAVPTLGNVTAASSGTHPQGKSQQNVVFIHKLYDILENKDLAHLIWWSDNGHSFFIKPNEQFSKTLAKYFKHTNITSFVRQLNIYGFHKVTNLNESSSSMAEKERHTAEVAAAAAAAMSPTDKEDNLTNNDNNDKPAQTSSDVTSVKIWEFKHSAGIFKRGDRESLKYIKRRSSSRNNSNINRKKLNLLAGPHGHMQGMPGIQGSVVHNHSNLSSSVDFDGNDHIGIARTHSSFTPYSSSENMINTQGSYGQAMGQQVLLSTGQQQQHQQPNSGFASQAGLKVTNEFMTEQFNSLSNDMMQLLNVLQNFVTLQNSITIHENPTKPVLDNFQNQYSLLYNNISNLKNNLMSKYQSLSSSFYEQQQYMQQQQPVGQGPGIIGQPVQYQQMASIPQGYGQANQVYIPQQVYVTSPQSSLLPNTLSQQQPGVAMSAYPMQPSQQQMPVLATNRTVLNTPQHSIDETNFASVKRDPNETHPTNENVPSKSVNAQLLNPVVETQEGPEYGAVQPQDDRQKLSIPASPGLTTVAYTPARKLSSATSTSNKNIKGNVHKPEINQSTNEEVKIPVTVQDNLSAGDSSTSKNSKVYSLLNNSESSEVKKENEDRV